MFFANYNSGVEFYKQHVLKVMRVLPNIQAVVTKNGKGVQVHKYKFLLENEFKFYTMITTENGNKTTSVEKQHTVNMKQFKLDPDFTLKNIGCIPGDFEDKSELIKEHFDIDNSKK